MSPCNGRARLASVTTRLSAAEHDPSGDACLQQLEAAVVGRRMAMGWQKRTREGVAGGGRSDCHSRDIVVGRLGVGLANSELSSPIRGIPREKV